MLRAFQLVFVIAALGVLAFVCVRTHAPAIEADIAARAGQALQQGGFAFAKVRADGRDVILIGDAPDGDTRAQALAAVEAIDGVASVEDRMTVPGGDEPAAPSSLNAAPAPPLPPMPERAPAPAPETPSAADLSTYRFEAELKAGILTLGGNLPTQAEKDRLLVQLRKDFPTVQVADQVLLQTDGMPDGAWPDAVTLGLGQLAKLTTGTFAITGRTLTLDGTAPEPDTREGILRALGDLPAAYRARADIATPAGAPGLVEIGGGADAEAALQCQRRFDALIASGSITFQSGRAAIGADSTGLLDQLAEAALACPDARIIVTGHTDSEGRAEINERLSRLRAIAVRNALTQRGVPRARLEAQGWGSARPVAGNDTEEGRARNRRIEFIVQ